MIVQVPPGSWKLQVASSFLSMETAVSSFGGEQVDTHALKVCMLDKGDLQVLTFNSLPALQTGKCSPSMPELYKADISKSPEHLLLRLLGHPCTVLSTQRAPHGKPKEQLDALASLTLHMGKKCSAGRETGTAQPGWSLPTATRLAASHSPGASLATSLGILQTAVGRTGLDVSSNRTA